MKSQRRHELQKNVLEMELSRAWDFLRKNGNYLAWGALAVAVVVLAVVWYVRKTRAERDAVQTQFANLAMMPSGDERLAGLESLAGKTSHPRWAALATVGIGREYATRLVLSWTSLTPAQRQELRQQAQTYYRQAIEKFPAQEEAAAQAHLGLGRLAESFGDLETARSEYQMARQMTALSGHPIAGAAADALMQLDQYRGAVYMPETAPARTQPATGAATRPASRPATGAASTAPATGSSQDEEPPAVPTTAPATSEGGAD